MSYLGQFSWTWFLVVGFIGLIISAGICGLAIRFWPYVSYGWDSGDLVRKAQRSPVLRIGGLGILGGLVVLTALASTFSGAPGSMLTDVGSIFLVCVFFFGIGFVDDLRPLPAWMKFGAQILGAVFAYILGIRIDLVSEPFTGTSMALHGLSLPVTAVWLVAIPNLINLVDGMDGIAGGVSISLISVLAVVSWMGGDFLFAVLCVGMVGAVLGFLFFNLPKAKIYLGDGGAYLVGAFIASTSAAASQKGAVAGALFVVVLALALPIADTVFAILRRAFYGLPVWRADAEHIHHRLVTLGVRKGVVIGGMIAAVFIFSLLGLSLVVERGQTWPIVLTILVTGLLYLTRLLGYWGSVKSVKKHVLKILTTRERVRYAYALGLVLEHEIDRVAQRDEFWIDFRRSLEKVGLRPAAKDESASESTKEKYGGILEVPMTNGLVWRLKYQHGKREMHWGKVAACFLGPLSRGITQWGEIPSGLGIQEVSSDQSRSESLSRTQSLPSSA